MSDNFFFFTNQLNETETAIITSIVDHIGRGEKKISIAQIAAENYVSTAFIMKMSKRLGFNGYTDLVYNLSQRRESDTGNSAYGLKSLLDNYSEERIEQFIGYLKEFRSRKLFVVGEGFAAVTADYIAQRLAVCGFMVFNRVHFYDYMLFRDSNGAPLQDNIEPAFIIAISQSGETDQVLKNVERAKQNGFKVISFTKMENSTLAKLSDLCFVIDGSGQSLTTAVPNPFFGKLILAVEEILGIFYNQKP